MEWGFVTALVLVILAIIILAGLVWYFSAGNIMAVFKNIRMRQAQKKAGLKSSLNGDIKK
jgi:uncharacterized protein involved in outer membrane biogenesis